MTGERGPVPVVAGGPRHTCGRLRNLGVDALGEEVASKTRRAAFACGCGARECVIVIALWRWVKL